MNLFYPSAGHVLLVFLVHVLPFCFLLVQVLLVFHLLVHFFTSLLFLAHVVRVYILQVHFS